MGRRVVITGLGVCAPNGVGLTDFTQALLDGKSGIRHQPNLEKLGFGCQVAGEPLVKDNLINSYFTPLERRGLNASGIVYGVIAGVDAWNDAGLVKNTTNEPSWDRGIVFGTGILGVDKFREAIHLIDDGNVRRLGSTSVIQTMASGISAYLGGMLGCGNQVTTNSAACTTGTEGIIMAYDRISQGKAEIMLTGSCSDSGPYVWGGFDAMRILPRGYNNDPAKASRPMSATASGFIPGSGAGALVLESLESAQERSAHIYAEVLGGEINSGGQVGEGSMTAPNSLAVQRCITNAVVNAGIEASDIDVVNGHLTATSKDGLEIENWSVALNRKGADFPLINSFKGAVGHCLAAAGSIECVAAILQFKEQVVFKNINCEDVHPEITELIADSCIPRKTLEYAPSIIAKASFGFGDVNACVIFKAFTK
ncbi:MAG TPA: beta-ketoacyl-ACP synthase [Maribacter sp.]|uniref:beta-ketoacyl-[acyl-carrier-protein] synthase family protein n=1 Tax=unclassified Maribacter TaxID=2615042 RepID=UPI000EDE71F3|nr:MULTISPECIES: beta-ketoacyl-[acyl-carrier-protein] synthase family protein [unclassified Maribacter]HAF76808.1 beta-ketoacyl-ACP synthase [Maribacter sp.]|tara:strand:- start:38557 stop:39831 length:1275 start_codon:yes stop_codon:yes gene_type:complete